MDRIEFNRSYRRSLLCFIILAFQIAIVPLIVYLNILPINGEGLNYWNSNENWDFFSYYKSGLTVLSSAIITILMTIELIRKRIRIRSRYFFIAISLYTILLILSAAFSSYPITSLYGFPDRYEGILVLISYIALLLGPLFFITNKKQILYLLIALCSSATIICTVGILQYFGYDLFKTNLGQAMIIPSQYADFKHLVRFQGDSLINTGNAIYSTLFNPNSFGQYMAMLFPFSLMVYVLVKNTYYKIALGALACFMFTNLIGSLSRGSYVGVLISLLVTFIIFRRKLYIRWKSLISLVFVFLLIYLGMNGFSGGIVNSRIQSLPSKTENHPEDRRLDKIKSFTLSDSKLAVYCTSTVLNLSLRNEKLLLADTNNNRIDLNQVNNQGKYELLDERYKNYSLYIIDNLIKVQKGKSFLYFAIVNNQFIFLDYKGVAQEIVEAEKIGFQGLERLGSGRGYIWSRTLPILKRTIALGSGPDTYAMEFPQKDYMGKLNFMYDAYIIIDKPHNMYLQTAINTGVISAFVLIGIFATYIVRTIKILRYDEKEDFYTNVGIAIFSAMLGYMISGIFTDSTVSVAPVFWILLGLGMKINYLKAEWYNKLIQM